MAVYLLQRGSGRQTSDPPLPSAEPSAELPSLPSAADLSWIAGPAGALRICDIRPSTASAAASYALPVLFVHGLGGRLEQWAAQLCALAPERRVLAFDLPGHGDSDAGHDDDYGVERLAASVAALANTLSLRRFVLVGHSLGATVAAAYAGAHPERVAGLFLADPNGDQTRMPAKECKQFLRTVKANPSSEVRWYFQQLVASSPAAVSERVLADLEGVASSTLLRALEGAAVYSPLPDLERYPGPMLSVISGLNSLPYSLHNLYPALPVSALEDTGHWLMMDAPIPFNKLLDAFLRQAAHHEIDA